MDAPADAGHSAEGRTAADNATVRTVFIIGPDKKMVESHLSNDDGPHLMKSCA